MELCFVTFDKGQGAVNFGPFNTVEDARSFIEEDLEERRQFMTVNHLIRPMIVRPVR